MNEVAAFILVAIGAMFLVHVVQGASGVPNAGGTNYLKSFFSSASPSATTPVTPATPVSTPVPTSIIPGVA